MPVMQKRDTPPDYRRDIFQRFLVYAILIVATIQTVYPLVWIIFGSLKSDSDMFNNVWGPPRMIVWQNYADAWRVGNLGNHIGNSIVVTVLSLLLLLFVSSMAAYVLAKMAIPGKQWVFLLFLITMMIPSEVTVIPLFLVVKTLGLLNSHLGLVLVYVASGTAFSTFLLRGFFLSIPAELEDAALVDGANHFQVFWRVVLPLALPGLATVAIFEGMQIWNEFFLAFVFIRQPELQTIPLGLVNFFARYQTDWTLYFAALTMVAVPVVALYIAMQRWFVEGLTAGALKG